MSTSPTPDLHGTLSQAASGLAFPSETDAPLVPFAWPDAEPAVTPENVARAANLDATARIEEQSLEDFFAPAAAEEEWQDEDERATARRFQELLKVLRESLGEARAFRVGEVAVDVYIVGRAPQGLAGLQTKVVES